MALLIFVIIGGVFLNMRMKKQAIVSQAPQADQTTDEAKTYNLCYYRSDKTDIDLYDKAWLKLSLTGSKVTGEFQDLPSEKDSKVGTFEGEAFPLDQSTMSRSADVWWDSRAEGMEVKEELKMKWGDQSATVGYGEMVDRGDGTYVYKDKENLYWIKQMNQIDCDDLQEKLAVEKYVKDNIKTIAVDEAVLGGSFYTISISTKKPERTGEVTYEDGHIQSKATFTYSYDTDTNKIVINDFKVAK